MSCHAILKKLYVPKMAVILTISVKITAVIIYTKKLLNSDSLRKECSSSVTRVQTYKMVSDWLKTQKKPSRTNQIRAVLTTKFKKMAMVFSRRRRDLILYAKQQ